MEMPRECGHHIFAVCLKFAVASSIIADDSLAQPDAPPRAMWLLCWYADEPHSRAFRAAELRALAACCLDGRPAVERDGVDGLLRVGGDGAAAAATTAAATTAAAVAEAAPPAPPWARALAPNSVLMPVWFQGGLEAASAVARRSVLMRALLEVWGSGETLERCVAATVAATNGGVRGRAGRRAGVSLFLPPSPEVSRCHVQ
jgi:hypothetical protein